MQLVSGYLNSGGTIRLSQAQETLPAGTTIWGLITYITSE